MPIYNTDCLEFLQNTESNTIDICVTSPPYNIGINYNHYNDNQPSYTEWLGKVCNEICRVLKPNGHFFLNLSATRKNPTFPYTIAKTIPWTIQNPIIWAKSIEIDKTIRGHGWPTSSNRYLSRGWEMLWHFTQDGNTPIDRKASGVKYSPQWAEDNEKRTGRNWRPTTDIWHIPYETVGFMGKQASQLKGNKKHPAIFPAALVRKCLEVAGCKENMTVLDPFAGTGTTLMVAKQFGAVGIGCEIDKDYVAFINERLQQG